MMDILVFTETVKRDTQAGLQPKTQRTNEHIDASVSVTRSTAYRISRLVLTSACGVYVAA